MDTSRASTGSWLREHTLVKEAFRVDEGNVLVPEGPGIGVEVDLPTPEKFTHEANAWKN